MLLAIAYAAAEFAQICPKLSNFAKIYPKAISLRNFENPPKIEILIFFKKQTQYTEDKPNYVLTVWTFNTTIFYMPFLVSKNFLCM
jgi:hypothetical protein